MTAVTVGGSATSARGRERFGAIVAAATDLFDAKGFASTSMDEVGEAAGISGPGLYRHVGGKQELLVAVFADIWTRLKPAIDEAAEAPPSTALRILATAHVDFVVNDPASLRLLFREGRHLPADRADAVRRSHDRWVAAFVAALTADEPTLSTCDARIRVLAAQGSLDALALHAEPSDLSGREPELTRRTLAILAPP